MMGPARRLDGRLLLLLLLACLAGLATHLLLLMACLLHAGAPGAVAEVPCCANMADRCCWLWQAC
jgi:hypothetical protein